MEFSAAGFTIEPAMDLLTVFERRLSSPGLFVQWTVLDCNTLLFEYIYARPILTKNNYIDEINNHQQIRWSMYFICKMHSKSQMLMCNAIKYSLTLGVYLSLSHSSLHLFFASTFLDDITIKMKFHWNSTGDAVIITAIICECLWQWKTAWVINVL